MQVPFQPEAFPQSPDQSVDPAERLERAEIEVLLGGKIDSRMTSILQLIDRLSVDTHGAANAIKRADAYDEGPGAIRSPLPEGQRSLHFRATIPLGDSTVTIAGSRSDAQNQPGASMYDDETDPPSLYHASFDVRNDTDPTQNFMIIADKNNSLMKDGMPVPTFLLMTDKSSLYFGDQAVDSPVEVVLDHAAASLNGIEDAKMDYMFNEE